MQVSNFFLLEQTKKSKLLNLNLILSIIPLEIVLKNIKKNNQKARIEKNKCAANTENTEKCQKMDPYNLIYNIHKNY